MNTVHKLGLIAMSTDHLQIAGDSIYGQYFPGTIDQIRIYNPALSATELQSDMNTARDAVGLTATRAAAYHDRRLTMAKESPKDAIVTRQSRGSCERVEPASLATAR